ncbi:MAG: TIGR02147 family protein [Proteobacteria bacterium]|nr:TIGR02147 family protein [Pseudomonadota bacterium]
MPPIFIFSDYKQYLTAILESSPNKGHGIRSKWARAIGCHTTFVSQVLRGQSELSLEHAMQLTSFLNLDAPSERFLLLLVNYARAGSAALRAAYQREIQQMRDTHLTLGNRIRDSKQISEAEQIRFYSSWYYAAAHVAVSIPSLREVSRLGQVLGLPMRRLLEVLDCLRELDLIEILPNGTLRQTTKSLHLDKSSPLISKHHINWRVQAVRAIEQEAAQNFHYSSVVSLAEMDLPQVKAILIDAIEKIRAVVRDSKEEKIYAYTVDLFSAGG